MFGTKSRAIWMPVSLARLKQPGESSSSLSLTVLTPLVNLQLTCRLIIRLFPTGNEEKTVISAATRYITLTAYFKLNQQQEGARQYFYREISHHYLFDKKF
jgi:hypothetical protein